MKLPFWLLIHCTSKKINLPWHRRTVPFSDQAGVEARKSAYSPQPFTLFDHWLLLIWRCPLSGNDFPLVDPTSHLSERIKGVKLGPDNAYGPSDGLPTEGSPAPTISNSASFVVVGTGLGYQWQQKGLCTNCETKLSWICIFYLCFFIFLNAANFMVVTMKYIFNRCNRKFV